MLDQLSVGAIASLKSLAQLERTATYLWAQWADGRLADDHAQNIAEAIEKRRREVRGIDTVAVRAPAVAGAAKAAGRPSYFPPKRKAVISKDKTASMARRRTLAASGPMPPTLACHFTTGELAALRIVADAVRDTGSCSMCVAEIAARAGVGLTTARNALRYAARKGFITIQERRRDKQPNLPNLVRILSREWTTWLARGAKITKNRSKGGGVKKAESTDRSSFRTKSGDRFSSGRPFPLPYRKAPPALASG